MKRIRLVKVHAWIIGELKSQMPAMMGKMEKMNSVHSLLRWDEYVDHPEVIFQAVTNKQEI